MGFGEIGFAAGITVATWDFVSNLFGEAGDCVANIL